MTCTGQHRACAEPRLWQAQGSDSQLPTDLEAPRTEDRHTEEPVGPHLSWDTHRGTKESVFCRVVGSSSKREAMSLPCGTATRRYLICSPAFLRPTRPWAPWVKPQVRDLPLLPQALKHGEAQGPSPLVQPPTPCAPQDTHGPHRSCRLGVRGVAFVAGVFLDRHRWELLDTTVSPGWPWASALPKAPTLAPKPVSPTVSHRWPYGCTQVITHSSVLYTLHVDSLGLVFSRGYFSQGALPLSYTPSPFFLL